MAVGETTMKSGLLGRLGSLAGQHRTASRVGIAAILLAIILVFLLSHTASQPPPHQAPVITMVTIQPPKPPPPPPPLPTPKMITPPKMTVPDTKPMTPAPTPKNAPPKPAAPSVTPMGTSIHNNGPADAFNLSGTPGGGGFGGLGGGGGGSALAYYQSQVANEIANALQKNPITRKATAGLKIRVWASPSGAVTRVELVSSSGDPKVDAAVQNDVLPSLSLGAPPPGTPMPMVMKLTGEQPLQ